MKGILCYTNTTTYGGEHSHFGGIRESYYIPWYVTFCCKWEALVYHLIQGIRSDNNKSSKFQKGLWQHWQHRSQPSFSLITSSNSILIVPDSCPQFRVSGRKTINH